MNPPRFRKGSEFSFERCETCENYTSVGYCAKYRLPVSEKELCDSFVSILVNGKRQ